MRLHPSPIIVVGMQRSGTSALAGALRELGLFFGMEELLYQADGNNEKGYFEHRKATILNLRCLHTFQMHPTSFNRLPANWREHPEAESLRSELKAFLKEDFADRGRWAIKQPVTSLVLPLYNDVFRELGIHPHYVLCVRNPLESMASEANLDFGASYRVMASLGEMAVGSWLRYTLGSYADAVGNPLTVVVYDDLLSQPEATLRRILHRHDDWSPTLEAWDKAIGSIQIGLRHNRSTDEGLDAYPAIVKQTYHSSMSFDDSDSHQWESVLSLHREFEGWVELLGDPAPPAGKLGLAWIQDGKQRIAEARFQPNGDWQTVSLLIDAPPKCPVSGLLYGWPFRAWIRRSVWKVGNKETVAAIRLGLGSSLTFDHGVHRLDGVFEPNQVNLTTPGGKGPYELRLEFLLEYGPSIAEQSAGVLAKKVEECVRSVQRLARTTPARKI